MSLPIVIEPVSDTSSMAPPPATPFGFFIQEPGVTKDKKQKHEQT